MDLLQHAPALERPAAPWETSPRLIEDDEPYPGHDYLELKTGLLKGFADYSRRFQMQGELKVRRAALRYLHLAFSSFPKLRHVAYTDFRALARKDEKLVDL